MQLAQMAGLPANRANPTWRMIAPPAPPKGAAQSLQWGSLGTRLKTRRMGRMNGSSPERNARMVSSGERFATATIYPLALGTSDRNAGGTTPIVAGVRRVSPSSGPPSRRRVRMGHGLREGMAGGWPPPATCSLPAGACGTWLNGGGRSCPRRTKVYRVDTPAQAQSRSEDEAQAAAHGWRVVAREFQADGTLRVTFQHGVANEWEVTTPAQSAPATPPPPPVVYSQSQSSGGGFGQAMGQGFGWGCGCLLLIVVIFVGLIVLGSMGGR